MTKEEAWLLWMKESKHYVEYDWDMVKKSSWWEAFSRGWDAASVNANGWDDAYKMGIELGKEMEKEHMVLNKECYERGCAAYDDRVDEGVVVKTAWKNLTTAEVKVLWNLTKKPSEFAEALGAKLKEKNYGQTNRMD